MPRHKSRYISTRYNPNKPLIYLAGIRDADRFGAMVKASKRLWPLRVEIEARIASYNRIARKLQLKDAVATLARPLFIRPLGVGIQVESANPCSPRPLLDKSTSAEPEPEPAEHSKGLAEEAPTEESAAEELEWVVDMFAAREESAEEPVAREEDAV